MATLKIKLLKKGDSVLNVWENRVAIKRKNGEVDIYTLIYDEFGHIRFDSKHKIKICFGIESIEVSNQARNKKQKKTTKLVKVVTF